MAFTHTLSRLLQHAASALEQASVLDRPAEALDSVVSRLPDGAVTDALSGVAVGHPVHPALVAVPIGPSRGPWRST